MRPWLIDAEGIKLKYQDVWSRILPRITFVLDTDCWRYEGLWNNGQGYSKIRLRGEAVYVHRIVYAIFKRTVPKSLEIDHECRNRWCCNPVHLQPRRRKTNMVLMHKRQKKDVANRKRLMYKEAHPR